MHVFRYPSPIAGCIGHIQSDDGRMVIVFTAAGGVYVREMTSPVRSVAGSFTFGQAGQEAPPWAPAAEVTSFNPLGSNGIPPHTVPELFSILAMFGCVTGEGRGRIVDVKANVGHGTVTDATEARGETIVVPLMGIDLSDLPFAEPR